MSRRDWSVKVEERGHCTGSVPRNEIGRSCNDCRFERIVPIGRWTRESLCSHGCLIDLYDNCTCGAEYRA
jgi:hypothetical protein